MNKVAFGLFGLLTLGAVGFSAKDVGVSSPEIDRPSQSVRQGSSRGGFFVGGSSGGSSRGK
jgi:hypothetical protein